MPQPADTLVLDTLQTAAWRSNSDFDYGRELALHEPGMLEQMWESVRQAWANLFTDTLGGGFSEQTWLFITFLLVAAVLSSMAIRHGGFFARRRTEDALDYEVTEDTIYGIDFLQSISRAVADSRWSEAVRLAYLQVLRRLSDVGWIAWRPSKTPTQYTREVTTTDFRALTAHFLRVRYGGFAATEEVWHEVERLAQAVTATLPAAEAEKGGES